MKTIEYIKTHGLEKLVADFKLNAVHHESLPLVLLKYNQIESPKYHEITRECRSLILEKETWKVAARSFRRFYNLNEHENDVFDWDDFVIQEKIDGSLILLFHYNDEWHITTSGSFAKGKIQTECPHTWESLFFSIVCKEKIWANLCKDHTYIFELCSPYNKVVKLHKQPHVVLLSAFCKLSYFELGVAEVNWAAAKLNVARPAIFDFGSLDNALEWLEKQPSDFEGFVLRDRNNNRLKVKSKAYLSLHSMAGNGYIYLTRRLLPLVLNKSEEKDELLSYFPEIREKWDFLENEIGQLFKNADEILALYHDYDQKKFALAIKGEEVALKNILFTCRKNGQLPSSVKQNFEDLLVKHFEEKTCVYSTKKKMS